MCWLGDEDALPPRALHPIFFGSFDWHSCVHGWWTLLTLRRLFPDMPEARAIAELADDSFTRRKGRRRARLSRPAARAAASSGPMAGRGCFSSISKRRGIDEAWGARARAAGPRLRRAACATISTILTYPIRVGTHFNTAFALILALEWADAFDPALAELIRDRARHWFGGRPRLPGVGAGRRRVPVAGADRGLVHGARRIRRCSRSGSSNSCRASREREPATLFAPAIVSDRSDGKIAHLDGLNLSRAWCWRELALFREHRAKRRTSPPRCRTSPATIWASIGSRASRCWRCCPASARNRFLDV